MQTLVRVVVALVMVLLLLVVVLPLWLGSMLIEKEPEYEPKCGGGDRRSHRRGGYRADPLPRGAGVPARGAAAVRVRALGREDLEVSGSRAPRARAHRGRLRGSAARALLRRVRYLEALCAARGARRRDRHRQLLRIPPGPAGAAGGA